MARRTEAPCSQARRLALIVGLCFVAPLGGACGGVGTLADPGSPGDTTTRKFNEFERREINTNPNRPKAVCLPGRVARKNALASSVTGVAVVVTDGEKKFRISPDTGGEFQLCFEGKHVLVEVLEHGLLQDSTEFDARSAPSRIDLFIGR